MLFQGSKIRGVRLKRHHATSLPDTFCQRDCIEANVCTNVGNHITGPYLVHQMLPNFRLILFRHHSPARRNQNPVRSVNYSGEAFASGKITEPVVSRTHAVP